MAGEKKPEPFMSNAAFGLVAALILGGFGFVIFYFRLGYYPTMEETRPLLVLALIVSMLGFGGLLIVRALFAPVDGAELQLRFRLAREIFLVFSGIFGTIIGFYFGSTDNEPTTPPALEISHAGNRLSATVTGGAAPFLGIFTPPGGSAALMEVDGRVLSVTGQASCPEGAKVEIVDGRGRRVEETVDCDEPERAPDNATEAVTNNVTG